MTDLHHEADRQLGQASPSERHRAIVAELDTLVRALQPSRPLYSEDLAQQTGISVRTLQVAVRSVTGLSLHRYLRRQRLSRVRHQLLTDAPSVKAAALANGFWHLGDFSQVYTQTFGERPSQTLARAAEHGVSPTFEATDIEPRRCLPAARLGPDDASRRHAGSHARVAGK